MILLRKDLCCTEKTPTRKGQQILGKTIVQGFPDNTVTTAMAEAPTRGSQGVGFCPPGNI